MPLRRLGASHICLHSRGAETGVCSKRSEVGEGVDVEEKRYMGRKRWMVIALVPFEDEQGEYGTLRHVIGESVTVKRDKLHLVAVRGRVVALCAFRFLVGKACR